MRFPKFKHAAFAGAILGALGPLLYYTSRPARDYILGNGLFLWPTGVILLVTYGHEHDFFGYVVTAISIALNIVLYAAALALLWFIVLDYTSRGDDQNANQTSPPFTRGLGSEAVHLAL